MPRVRLPPSRRITRSSSGCLICKLLPVFIVAVMLFAVHYMKILPEARGSLQSHRSKLERTRHASGAASPSSVYHAGSPSALQLREILRGAAATATLSTSHDDLPSQEEDKQAGVAAKISAPLSQRESRVLAAQKRKADLISAAAAMKDKMEDAAALTQMKKKKEKESRSLRLQTAKDASRADASAAASATAALSRPKQRPVTGAAKDGSKKTKEKTTKKSPTKNAVEQNDRKKKKKSTASPPPPSAPKKEEKAEAGADVVVQVEGGKGGKGCKGEDCNRTMCISNKHMCPPDFPNFEPRHDGQGFVAALPLDIYIKCLYSFFFFSLTLCFSFCVEC